MKKSILFFSIFIALIASCSKEQITVKKLDGSWKLRSMTFNGSICISSGSIDFDKCKQKKGKCDGDVSINGNCWMTGSFEYEVTRKGREIEMDFVFDGVPYSIFADMELDKDDLSLEFFLLGGNWAMDFSR